MFMNIFRGSLVMQCHKEVVPSLCIQWMFRQSALMNTSYLIC